MEKSCRERNKLMSVVIPVLNEKDQIHRLLGHLSDGLFAADCQVIIVDGNPSGSTIQAIDHQGLRFEIKKIISPKGRGIQMNAGAAQADGCVLVFLHADTILEIGAFQEIESVLCSRKNYVGGAFDLGIDSPRPVFRIIEKVASLRSRITRIPYGDQAFFVRTDYFRTIGGFSEIPLMEDVDLLRRIKKRGDRICIVPRKAWTSPRRWEQEGVLSCTLRNWMLYALYLCGVAPERLAMYYPKQ
jgi:rSAM/selenodomain-associated transferase 2